MRRLLFAMLPLPALALAQDFSPLSPNVNARLPPCGAAMDGQVMCRFGVVYECEFVSADGTEHRTGWRWTSDLLRGCDSSQGPVDLPSQRSGHEPSDLTYSPQMYGYDTPGRTGAPRSR